MTPNAHPDIPAAIYDFLVQPSPLFVLTSTRIWGEMTEPPPGYTPSLGGGIAFTTRGGNSLYAPVFNPRVQFLCYGITAQQAYTVYMALYNRLHEAKSGTFKMALCDVLGQTLPDSSLGPNGGWQRVLTFFRFWF